MADTVALATPPQTRFDPSRTMSQKATETCVLIVTPAFYADHKLQDATFARLRREDPLAWCEPEAFRPFWAVTKHADIMEVSRQNALFTNGQREMLSYAAAEEGVYAKFGQPHLLKTLVQLDDPVHYKLRHLTQEWFMPQNVKKREDAIKTIAKQYVDRMEDLGDECDFQRDVALYYPLRVIMQILGVPESDEPMMLMTSPARATDATAAAMARVESGSFEHTSMMTRCYDRPAMLPTDERGTRDDTAQTTS